MSGLHFLVDDDDDADDDDEHLQKVDACVLVRDTTCGHSKHRSGSAAAVYRPRAHLHAPASRAPVPVVSLPEIDAAQSNATASQACTDEIIVPRNKMHRK
eukprot:3941812-Rhodomonas_salina.7